MVNLIRRFQQPLLIALTIIIIIAFVVLYNLPSTQAHGPRTELFQIYGRGVTQAELSRTGRRLELCQELGLFEMLMSLVGNVRSRNDAAENFIWNTLILRHEAEQLGIMSANPSKGEQEDLSLLLAERIKELPAFQTNGAFDVLKYTQFLQTSLAPRGFSAGELDEVVADSLRLEKLKEVLGSTVAATPSEIRSSFQERSQKVEVSVVRFKFDEFKNAVQASDDDVKKLFEERKATLTTPEKRKVKFVAFSLAKQTKPLAGKERADALQALADQAQEFAQKMTEKDAKLEDVAAKSNATVAETPFFEANDPPTDLDRADAAAQAAFKLTKEEPNSDVVSSPAGYYVLQLSGTEASRPLTLEEAKPKLVEQLKEERGRESMSLKAAEIRMKIEAALKAGKDIAAAAEAAGVKAEKLAPFSATEPLKDVPEAGEIQGRISSMADGELSEFIPSATGGLLVRLEKRLPIDEAEFEKQKTMLTEGASRNKREAIFREWLRLRHKVANIQAIQG